MYTFNLQTLTPKVGSTSFIAIDGRGGSGKSTLAEVLSKQLHAEIIHVDDFMGWDTFDMWHPSLIQEVILPILNGAELLSYKRSSWGDDHHPEPIENQFVTKTMILEGVGSLRTELREYISYGIFVATPKEVCLERGIYRDTQTGKSVEEITEIWKKWQEAEDTYFKNDNPQTYADSVIDGTKPFHEEFLSRQRAL